MIHERAQLAALGGVGAINTRPPGHTCPTIDKLKSSLRRIEWWDKNRPESRETITELVQEAHALLEVVREDNTQMRAAYWAARGNK